MSKPGIEPYTIPERIQDVIYNRCTDCHDEASKKGGLNLDISSIDWSKKENLKHWVEVFSRVSKDKMPPKNKPQLTAGEKKLVLNWLDEQLMKNSSVGGTSLRRLNKREIEDTLKHIFSIPDFHLPPGFPPDNESHGFDTIGEALVISPSHMAAYRDTGSMIADYLFPPERILPKS